MDWRSLILLALFAWAWEARAAAPDPVTSVMWDYYHQRLLNGEAFVFDDKIRLEVPPFAEDARQVPIQINASAYRGKVKRILAWAELNPIPQIFDFAPGAQLEAFVNEESFHVAVHLCCLSLHDSFDSVYRAGMTQPG